jgi:hypothetical protein
MSAIVKEHQKRIDAFVSRENDILGMLQEALKRRSRGLQTKFDARDKASRIINAQLHSPLVTYGESPSDFAMEELARQVVANSPTLQEAGFHKDAGGTRLFALELRHIVAKTVPTLYIPNQARMNFPVRTDIPASARTVEHRRIFGHGSQELGVIANKAADIIEVTLEAESDTRRMVPLARKVTWGIEELEEAAFGNVALDTELLSEMGRIAEWVFEVVAYQGAAIKTITGLYNNANVTLVAVITGAWAAATADQIYGDCEQLIEANKAQNQYNHTPNRLAVPSNRWRYLNMRRTNTDSTVKERLEANYPGLQVFEVSRANTYDAAGTGPRMIAFYWNPDYLAIAESRRWQLEPPFRTSAFTWEVAGRQKLGGAFITVPLTVTYMDGI